MSLDIRVTLIFSNFPPFNTSTSSMVAVDRNKKIEEKCKAICPYSIFASKSILMGDFFGRLIFIQYAPKSWTCQFRQLRGVASESQWQHHCIYSLWAGEWNNMTNFSTDGCRNPQKVPNYSFGIFQFLAEFLKIIIWNQNRCCWLGSVYIFH